MLRGDEVGRAARRAPAEPRARPAAGRRRRQLDRVVAAARRRIAAAHGVRHETTLTGFKWISRVPGLVFGYEEALGYCVAPERVRDKDGITAALLVAELAARLKAKGRTLLDVLDDLAVAHGLHATDQLSVRVADLVADRGGHGIAALRTRPRTLGGDEVTQIRDLEPRAAPSTGGDALPPTDGLRYRTAGGAPGRRPAQRHRAEAQVLPGVGRVRVGSAGLDAARAEATRRLAALKADLASRAGPLAVAR